MSRCTRRSAITLIARNLAMAGCAGLFVACTESKPQFRSIDITGADYARDIRAQDAEGRVRSLQDFRGKVVAVFFGYVQCPDVCPTTLAELAAVRKELGKDGERLQGVFVTVDPERDTPEVLKAYMANFDASFIALRPTPEQLPALAKDFKVFYKHVPGKTSGSYTVEHTAASYLFDPQGRVRLYTRYGSGATALAQDVKLLLNGA